METNDADSEIVDQADTLIKKGRKQNLKNKLNQEASERSLGLGISRNKEEINNKEEQDLDLKLEEKTDDVQNRRRSISASKTNTVKNIVKKKINDKLDKNKDKSASTSPSIDSESGSPDSNLSVSDKKASRIKNARTSRRIESSTGSSSSKTETNRRTSSSSSSGNSSDRSDEEDRENRAKKIKLESDSVKTQAIKKQANNKKSLIKPQNQNEEKSTIESKTKEPLKEAQKKNNPMITVEEKVKDKKTLLKEQKIKAKKLEKVKSIRILLALLRMDVEIKKSLRLDNTDVERCYLIMKDLIKLPITQHHLFKASEIVETIRKCRKFKSSEKVKEIANECFHKFNFMFTINQGETFLNVFERERDKYLSDNIEKLKKERILASKLLADKYSSSTISTNRRKSLNASNSSLLTVNKSENSTSQMNLDQPAATTSKVVSPDTSSSSELNQMKKEPDNESPQSTQSTTHA